jgi:hypothetical protein
MELTTKLIGTADEFTEALTCNKRNKILETMKEIVVLFENNDCSETDLCQYETLRTFNKRCQHSCTPAAACALAMV